MALILLVRHGQTEWNRDGRFQGQSDSPLDEVGWEQAWRAAVRVKGVVGVNPADGPPVPVWSSDLSRARATSETIAAAIGSAVSTDGRLREMSMGRWEGLTAAEVALRYPDEWRQWSAGRLTSRGGGEGTHAAGARVADAITSIVPTEEPLTGPHPVTAVVVGHGLSLEAGMNTLAERGFISLAGPAPHLGNGEVLAVNLLCPTAEASENVPII